MMESQGGSGGVVVCLGVGGMMDLGEVLGLESQPEAPYSGVEVWVIDAHRPWNLGNVFGGFPLEPAAESSSSYQSRTPHGVTEGRIQRVYNPGKGGIVVFDDGDVEEDLTGERDAYLALLDMPEVEDNGEDLGSDDESNGDADEDEVNDGQQSPRAGQKRKSLSDGHDFEDSDDEDSRPRQRRRSNSVCPISIVESHFCC
jgi:cell division control protein 45